MSIVLDKGDKVNITAERMRLEVGWYPEGYIPKAMRKDKTIKQNEPIHKESKGFFDRAGDFLKGNARLGDVVNSLVDSVSGVVDDTWNGMTAEQFEESIKNVDIDASMIFLSQGRIVTTVYFAEKRAFNNAVRHGGDNTTGKAQNGKTMEDPKEYIDIDFSKLPKEIDEAVMFLNIFRADCEHQTFGSFGGSFAKLKNIDTNEELAFFNLDSKEYAQYQGIFLIRMYAYNGWRAEAMGIGVKKASYIEDMKNQYINNYKR